MKIVAGTSITEDRRVFLFKRGMEAGPFADLNALRGHLAACPGMPKGDLADFGRGCAAAKVAMLAAILTAFDHGAPLPEDTGILGWNGSGCVADNRRFWADYTANGRESGRGSLFVATLPTTPFCEAAIALGCRGAVAYCRTAPDTAKLPELLAPDRMTLAGEVRGAAACMVLLTPEPAEYPRFSTLAELFLSLRRPL